MLEGMAKLEKKEISQKAEFIAALNEELVAMEQTGKISAEQAQGKREAAELIEEGFSEDPKQDALIFSRVGVAGERGLTGIFNQKNQQTDSSETEHQERAFATQETRESNVNKIDIVAKTVENLIQEYAQILRGKLEGHSAIDRKDPRWGERIDALFAAVSSLQEAQRNFKEAFERMRASDVQLDDTTVQTIIQAGIELGEKLNRLK